MIKRRQALCSHEPLATSVFFSLILVLFFTLPSVLGRAEPVSSGVSAATAEAAPRVTPGEMNTGALLLQSDDGGLIEAPRLQTDVVMAVSGTIARVTVTQRFENPSDRWLEGIYVFPLPEQSAVDALRMEIGDRVIEGEIKGRERRRPESQPSRAGAAQHLHQLCGQYRPA
jgi:Ca-activated chloride channel homolog